MPKVLISYRRADTANVAGRIFDKLVAHYGADNVFMDISNTPLGIDFREHIAQVFNEGDILIALIGRDWVGALGDGARRIDRPNDMVRIEIEAALARKIPIIPVLIDDAPMPQPSDLPPTMEPLAYRNAAELDSFRDFHPHMDRLIRAMDGLVAARTAGKAEPAEPEVKEGGKEPAGKPASESTVTKPTRRVESGAAAATNIAAPERRPDISVRTFPVTPESLSPSTRPPEPTPAPVRAAAFLPGQLKPAAAQPASQPDASAVRITRILGWALLIVLILMFARSLGSVASHLGSKPIIDAGLSWLLLGGYYLWQVPLAWIFVALFLVWEFFAARDLPSPVPAPDADRGLGTVQLLAWPYATFVAIRDAASPGPESRRPVVLVFAGFFVSVILPRLVGLVFTDFGQAVLVVGSFYRIVELIWTATLWVMIWKIGRSVAFRSR